jgi:uncharacterized protein YjeT (DUF2065 family)
MLIIPRLIGLLMLVAGVVFFIDPKTMKRYMAFWTQGSRISTIGAPLNLIFGILLLIAASQCRVSLVITIMGILSLIKGIVLFVSGPEKAKAMINKWGDKPEGLVRLLSLLVLGMGVLFLWSI